MRRLNKAQVAFAAFLACACASTTYVATWRSPTAKPLHLKGAKVAAVVLVTSEPLRKAAENRLAQEITSRGAIGVAMYTIVPDAQPGDEAKVRAVLEQANFKAVVAMHPVGKKTEIHVQSQPGYDHLWGDYYRYGWSTRYAPADTVTTYAETIVTVDTRVYSLEQNELVWEGQSETSDPSTINAFISDLAEATARKLSEAGLIQ